jgi:tripartite ATP-independent transporter DctM subunit
MLIIGIATAMARALTQSGFSQWLVAAMASVPGGKGGFLAITAVAFVILGSVLEGIPAIVLFGPLLFPVAKAMGVHEVHLRAGDQPGDGHRAVRAAIRRGVLRCLRDRAGVGGRRAGADVAVPGRAGGGAGDRCRVPLAVDRALLREADRSRRSVARSATA